MTTTHTETNEEALTKPRTHEIIGISLDLYEICITKLIFMFGIVCRKCYNIFTLNNFQN